MLRTITGTFAGHGTRHNGTLGCFYSVIAHGSRSGSRRISPQLPLKDLFAAVPGQSAPWTTARPPHTKSGQFFYASTHRLCPEGRPSTLSQSLTVMPKRLYQRPSVAWRPPSAVARGNTLFINHGTASSRRVAMNLQQQYQTRGMANQSLQRFNGTFTIDSSNKLVYPIVAINVMVFATWQYAEGKAKRFQDGRLYLFMFKNFANSLTNLREGRLWTLLTSAFSHKDWYHILLNTVVFLSFGPPVWEMLGTRRFLAVYLGSAIVSSLASIGYYAYLGPYLRRIQHKPEVNPIHYSLGASGAVMGLTTAFACVHPFAQYSLFFVINMPAVALLGLFGTYELYNILTANTGRFDSASHLGGAMFGAGYYFLKLRPLIRRMGR